MREQIIDQQIHIIDSLMATCDVMEFYKNRDHVQIIQKRYVITDIDEIKENRYGFPCVKNLVRKQKRHSSGMSKFKAGNDCHICFIFIALRFRAYNSHLL
ncbi:hypothetical protein KP509_1Z296100 [Ceratopteris richardii]|nr:hypothetical protein KP509_1Z296100 [Ceratopteris richardii]